MSKLEFLKILSEILLERRRTQEMIQDGLNHSTVGPVQMQNLVDRRQKQTEIINTLVDRLQLAHIPSYEECLRLRISHLQE